jgi:hypothetical protein
MFRGVRVQAGGRAEVAIASEDAKNFLRCHPERTRGICFFSRPKKKQIPLANPALGMTRLDFSARWFSRDIQKT